MADPQLIASINACSTSIQTYNETLTALQRDTSTEQGVPPKGLASYVRLLVPQTQSIMSTLVDAHTKVCETHETAETISSLEQKLVQQEKSAQEQLQEEHRRIESLQGDLEHEKSQSNKLQTLANSRHLQELNDLRQSKDTEFASMREQLNQQLKAKDESEKNLKSGHKQELSDLRQSKDKEFASMKEKLDQQLEAKDESEKNLKSRHEQELRDLRHDKDTEFASMREQLNQQLEAKDESEKNLKSRHEQELNDLRRSKDIEFASMREQLNQRLKAKDESETNLKSQHEQELRDLSHDKDTEYAFMRDQLDQLLETEQAAHDKTRKDSGIMLEKNQSLQSELRDLKSKTQKSNDDYWEEMRKMIHNHAAEVEDFRKQKTQLRRVNSNNQTRLVQLNEQKEELEQSVQEKTVALERAQHTETDQAQRIQSLIDELQTCTEEKQQLAGQLQIARGEVAALQGSNKRAEQQFASDLETTRTQAHSFALHEISQSNNTLTDILQGRESLHKKSLRDLAWEASEQQYSLLAEKEWELISVRSDLDLYRFDLQAAVTENTDTKAQLHQLTAAVSESNQLVQEKADENARLCSELAQQVSKLSSADRDIFSKDLENKDLSTQSAALRKQCDLFLRSEQENEALVSKLRTELSQVRNDLSVKGGDLVKAHRTILELEGELDQRNTRLRSVQEQLNHKITQSARRKAERSDLKVQVDCHVQEIARMKQTLVEASSQRKDLIARLTRLKRFDTKIVGELDDRETEVLQLETDALEMENRYAACLDKIRTLESEIATSSADLKTQATQAAAQDAQIETISTQLNSSLTEIDRYKSQVSKVSVELEELRALHTSTVSRCNGLERRLRTSNELCDQLKNKLEESYRETSSHRQSCLQLQQELDKAKTEKDNATELYMFSEAARVEAESSAQIYNYRTVIAQNTSDVLAADQNPPTLASSQHGEQPLSDSRSKRSIASITAENTNSARAAKKIRTQAPARVVRMAHVQINPRAQDGHSAEHSAMHQSSDDPISLANPSEESRSCLDPSPAKEAVLQSSPTMQQSLASPPSLEWADSTKEQKLRISRQRGEYIWSLFLKEDNVYDEDAQKVLLDQLTSAFSRDRSVASMIESIDKHAAGTFGSEPIFPRPCLFANITNGGSAGKGGSTMTRTNCPYCKQKEAVRICCYAMHIDGVNTRYGPRIDGVIQDTTYQSEGQPLTVHVSGQAVRWHLRRRKARTEDQD
jgi:hypothetical protein